MSSASRRAGLRTAVYPGSFDPLTFGHLDVLERGLTLFDRVIVAILRNPAKEPLFPVGDRIKMIEEACRERGWGGTDAATIRKNGGAIDVDVFGGLLVEYAESKGAVAILRGVRAVSDFEYEFQMALMNRKLNPRIQTVFMMPGEAYSYVSSRLVKEVAALGGDLSGVVPPAVGTRLRQRLAVASSAGAPDGAAPAAPGGGGARPLRRVAR